MTNRNSWNNSRFEKKSKAKKEKEKSEDINKQKKTYFNFAVESSLNLNCLHLTVDQKIYRGQIPVWNNSLFMKTEI